MIFAYLIFFVFIIMAVMAVRGAWVIKLLSGNNYDGYWLQWLLMVRFDDQNIFFVDQK